MLNYQIPGNWYSKNYWHFHNYSLILMNPSRMAWVFLVSKRQLPQIQIATGKDDSDFLKRTAEEINTSSQCYSSSCPDASFSFQLEISVEKSS